jgi:hypothetical protein
MSYKALGDGEHKSAEDHLVLLKPSEKGWVSHGCRGICSGVGVKNGLWRWKNSAFNKAICILAFEIGHHLPLPCEVVVTGELGSDAVWKIVEEGCGGELGGGRGGCNRRSIGGC